MSTGQPLAPQFAERTAQSEARIGHGTIICFCCALFPNGRLSSLCSVDLGHSSSLHAGIPYLQTELPAARAGHTECQRAQPSEVSANSTAGFGRDVEPRLFCSFPAFPSGTGLQLFTVRWSLDHTSCIGCPPFPISLPLSPRGIVCGRTNPCLGFCFRVGVRRK